MTLRHTTCMHSLSCQYGCQKKCWDLSKAAKQLKGFLNYNDILLTLHWPGASCTTKLDYTGKL